MASAAVNAFIDQPTVEGLKNLKKHELVNVAKKLEMEDITMSMRKPVIARKIVEYYVDEEVFQTDALEQFTDMPENKTSDIELKLKLQEIELEKLRFEEKEKERQAQVEL